MTDYHITPEEAIELFRHAGGADIAMAVRVHSAYAASSSNPRDTALLAYGACFHAGIVEGVRRERARRSSAVNRDNINYLFDSIAAEVREVIPLCTVGRFESASEALELLLDTISKAKERCLDG